MTNINNPNDAYYSDDYSPHNTPGKVLAGRIIPKLESAAAKQNF